MRLTLTLQITISTLTHPPAGLHKGLVAIVFRLLFRTFRFILGAASRGGKAKYVWFNSLVHVHNRRIIYITKTTGISCFRQREQKSCVKILAMETFNFSIWSSLGEKTKSILR